jgi:hypothetical protein
MNASVESWSVEIWSAFLSQKQLPLDNTNSQPKSSAYSDDWSLCPLWGGKNIDKRKGHPATGRPFLKGE